MVSWVWNENRNTSLNQKKNHFSGKLSYLHNKIYNTRPSCIHGNGRITKEFIDTIGNYIPLVWNPEDGCTACLDDTIDTRELNVKYSTSFTDGLWNSFICRMNNFPPFLWAFSSKTPLHIQTLFLKVSRNSIIPKRKFTCLYSTEFVTHFLPR